MAAEHRLAGSPWFAHEANREARSGMSARSAHCSRSSITNGLRRSRTSQPPYSLKNGLRVQRLSTRDGNLRQCASNVLTKSLSQEDFDYGWARKRDFHRKPFWHPTPKFIAKIVHMRREVHIEAENFHQRQIV